METVFVSIICVALIVVGGMTMSQGFLHSMDNTSNNIQVISQRDQDIMRTNIQIISAVQNSSNNLQITLQNSGQTKLTSFNLWDVIVNYFDAGGNNRVEWLPYNSGTGNQWNLQGIYIDAAKQTPEVFDPGILDPGEQMVINCQISPPTGHGTTNLVTVTTPNGVTISQSFTGY